MKMFSKKGVSQIIGVVLTVAIVVVSIGIIWGIVNSFVSDRLQTTGDCYSVLDKVHFNPSYTCHNSTGNYTLVSINVGDIDLSAIYISIERDGDSEIFILENKSQVLNNIMFYKGVDQYVKMPSKEGGKTYLINSTKRPSRIQIAPKVGDTLCDVSEIIDSVTTCY